MGPFPTAYPEYNYEESKASLTQQDQLRSVKTFGARPSSLRKNPEAVPLFSPVRADGFGGLSIVGGALACLIAVNYAATSLGMRIRL